MSEIQSELVVQSSDLRAETFRLGNGEGIAWQRCPIASRILVVTSGRGYLYRSHGRDETRDDLRPGDVLHVRRMVWHRLAGAGEEPLVATLVSAMPADAELRR